MKRAANCVLLILAAIIVIQTLTSATSSKLEGMSRYVKALKQSAENYPGLKVTFFGVSTLLLDDGQSAVMIDGFFSRPSKRAIVLSKIAPNKAVIQNALQRAGVKRLDAVLVSHSHYDHAMDCAEVAKMTSAKLVGSESTANIGRGAQMPEESIKIVKVGDRMNFGNFKVTFLPSNHAPTIFSGGEIKKPLVPPARAIDYREGESYSILIEHAGKSILVQSSAGWIDGALNEKKADVVFLGIGRLGKTNQKYKDEYWKQTVQNVGARRVIPIHWDDFTLPLSDPMKLAPEPFDDIDDSMTYVRDKGEKEHVDVRFPVLWEKFDPFDGL